MLTHLPLPSCYLYSLFRFSLHGNLLMTSTGGTNDIFIAKYQRGSVKDNSEIDSAAKSRGNELTTAGIEENSAGMQLYPNPAGETITIKLHGFATGELDVTISDLTGRSMFKKSQPSDEQSLDISRLSSGIYILQARQGNRMIVRRFIKK